MAGCAEAATLRAMTTAPGFRSSDMPSTTSAARTAAPAAKSPSPRIWMDGKLVDKEHAKISVYDHGFLYGDGCFEGIRVYNGRVFKLDTHLRRLYESAKK